MVALKIQQICKDNEIALLLHDCDYTECSCSLANGDFLEIWYRDFCRKKMFVFYGTLYSYGPKCVKLDMKVH